MTKQNQPVPSAEQQTKYWLEQNGYPELENIFHLFVEGPITRERLNGLLAPMFTRHAQLCVSAAVEAERERANKMQAASRSLSDHKNPSSHRPLILCIRGDELIDRASDPYRKEVSYDFVFEVEISDDHHRMRTNIRRCLGCEPKLQMP